MSRVIIVIAVCLASFGCSSAPVGRGAWQAADFAHASNPEVAAIAAALLKSLFSQDQNLPKDRIYYLSVVNADWHEVVSRTGLPRLATLMFGYRDHMITGEGIRDRATGLRVNTVHIEVDGPVVGRDRVQVIYTHSAGTGLGTSASKFTIEKKGGEWVIATREQVWTS